MTVEDVIRALDLPRGARVDRRVPKTLLVEHGAPTAADRRRINEGIEVVRWLAALKPTTIGVPAYVDEAREYLEVAVLSAVLRPSAQVTRLAELIHRAIPYPVFLVTSLGDAIEVSLAHKRWSRGEADAAVLDGAVLAVGVGASQDSGPEQAFLEALPLPRQPRTNLLALYQGWMDVVTALRAAGVTGAFRPAPSPEQAAERRAALEACERLEREMASLRAAASKERQIRRQVDMNLKLQRLRAEYAAAKAKL